MNLGKYLEVLRDLYVNHGRLSGNGIAPVSKTDLSSDPRYTGSNPVPTANMEVR